MLIGIDLSEFYLSVEWDLLEIPAGRNEEYYPCCSEPFAGNILHAHRDFLHNNLNIKHHFRYHIQNDNAAKDTVLHSQPNHSLCCLNFSYSSCLLLTK